MVIALHILGFGNVASSIVAWAGISAIISGFAFKDIAEHLLTGIFLVFHRPFEVGDSIEVVDCKGTVRDLTLRSTHIRNAQGRHFYVPNVLMLKNTLTNYTNDGLLRITFTIGIDPETDIETTQVLISTYLLANPHILIDPFPNIIVMDPGEFTTDIQVQFWLDLFKNKRNADFDLGNNIRSTTITEIKTIPDKHGEEMPPQVVGH